MATYAADDAAAVVVVSSLSSSSFPLPVSAVLTVVFYYAGEIVASL